MVHLDMNAVQHLKPPLPKELEKARFTGQHSDMVVIECRRRTVQYWEGCHVAGLEYWMVTQHIIHVQGCILA